MKQKKDSPMGRAATVEGHLFTVFRHIDNMVEKDPKALVALEKRLEVLSVDLGGTWRPTMVEIYKVVFELVRRNHLIDREDGIFW